MENVKSSGWDGIQMKFIKEIIDSLQNRWHIS